MPDNKIALIASELAEAQKAKAELTKLYQTVDWADADIIVALGGDGLMLQCLHQTMDTKQTIFGMNCGSVGFLMNHYSPDNLLERLAQAEITKLHPLRMQAVNSKGETHEALAINEVAVTRSTAQAAKLRIVIDGQERMAELVSDGILLATPAGSTAYNLSAHGPIIPIGARLLALTPVSVFRPRRWHGALLPDTAQVHFDVLEYDKRPVNAVADHAAYEQIKSVDIEQDHERTSLLLFDRDHCLEERILNEQFQP